MKLRTFNRILLVIISLGGLFFVFNQQITKVFAREYSSGFNLSCSAGGAQTTCTDRTSTPGQVYKWDYRMTRSDVPTATVDVCINTSSVMNTSPGHCWNIQTSSAANNNQPSDGNHIPYNDQTNYRSLVAQIIVDGSVFNNNDHEGNFNAYGRESEIRMTDVSLNPINVNGNTDLAWTTSWGMFNRIVPTCGATSGMSTFTVPNSNDTDNQTDFWTYQNNGTSGFACFTLYVDGFNSFGNIVTLSQQFPDIQVKGTMTGDVQTVWDSYNFACTINVTHSTNRSCDILVWWDTTNTQNNTVKLNGNVWAGPINSQSSSRTLFNPTPGSYNFVLEGDDGSQTLILDSVTITIYPDPGSGNPPPPPPPGSPTCSPANQSRQVGTAASFTAGGGNGTFSWTAPLGTPSSGSGVNFSTTYNAAGTRQVTVTSGGQSRTCNVTVTNTVPPPATDNPPTGAQHPIDNTNCIVDGWAYDQDTPNTSLNVELYINGPGPTGTYVGRYPANIYWAALQNLGYGNGDHRYTIQLPSWFQDNIPRDIYIYALNSNNIGPNTNLPLAGTSSRTAQCTPPVIIPTCPLTMNLANASAINDYGRGGVPGLNLNYWLADPWSATTRADNGIGTPLNRSTGKVGLSAVPGNNYPVGLSRGVGFFPPPGGKIRSITFDYVTSPNYDSNLMRMAIDYPGVANHWQFIGSGAHDSRTGSRTPGDSTATVNFPGVGADWIGLLVYQVSASNPLAVMFGDFYNMSITVDMPCNSGVTITANTGAVLIGQNTNISWTATDMTNATITAVPAGTPAPGALALSNGSGNGNFNTGPLTQNTTYTISGTARDGTGNKSASVTINVIAYGTLTINCQGPVTGGWQIHEIGFNGPFAFDYITGAAVTGSPPGSGPHTLGTATYYMTFTPVAGWATPAQRMVTVNTGANTNVNTNCDYTPSQSVLHVFSLNDRTGAPLSTSWRVNNSSGFNSGLRTGTDFQETNVTPNTTYSVDAVNLNSCIGGESFAEPSPDPSNVTTGASGSTTPHYLRWRQGTLQVRSNLNNGSWNFTPSVTGCTNTGSGTTSVDYHRAPGNITITAQPVVGYRETIEFNGVQTGSPYTFTLLPNTVADIIARYDADPPFCHSNPCAQNVALVLRQCDTIRINWTDTSDDETGYAIYYRTSPNGANNLITNTGTQFGSSTYLWSNPPRGNIWIVVSAFIRYGSIEVHENTPAVVGPTAKQACAPSFSGSIKDLYQVNGVPYTTATQIKQGDVLTFRFTITNSGTDRANVDTITDLLSPSLTIPSAGSGYNLRVDLDANGNYNGSAAERAVTLSGTAPNLTINVNRNKCSTNNNNNCAAATDPSCRTLPVSLCNNWVFLINAQVTSTVPNVRTEVQNDGWINYTYPIGSGITANYHLQAGPYLVSTTQPRVPQFREITP